MTSYTYKALTADGKVRVGSMDAADEKAVLRQLREAGLLPVQAVPADSRAFRAPWRLRAGWRKRHIDRRTITALIQDLATLLRAGLSIDRALRLLERQTQHPRLQPLLREVLEAIRGGSSLSSALARHPKTFDQLTVALIRAGEASGSIDNALKQLAEHRERSESFRSATVASLTYPTILIIVSALSLFVLMSFVVPRFVPLFADAGATLPFLTKLVFAAAGVFAATWWLVLVLAVGAMALFSQWLRNAGNRRRLDRWLLSIPAIGSLLRSIEATRFARTLGSTVGHGVSIVAGLKLCIEVTRNEEIRAAIEACRMQVKHGERISRALAETKAFPALVAELVSVGEEAGNVETALTAAADALEKKTQESLRRVVTLIEPVSILGLGGIIALVIVAILLAMLGLNELVV